MSIARWNIIHALLILAGMFLTIAFNRILILELLGLFSFLLLILSHHRELKKIRPYGGYANWITLARLLGILVTGYFFSSLQEVWFALIMFGLMLTDGLDGYLARRQKTVSSFGQYFDMESDSFYVALMTVILVLKGKTGEWFLLIGALRYLFVLAVHIMGWQKRKEKRTRLGPTIGVFVFFAVLCPFILPFRIYQPIMILAAIAVGLSFMYSFYLVAFREH